MPSRYLAQFALIGASMFAISACTPLGATNWYPNGYRYQNNDTPLSTPAPSRPWLKDAEIKDTEAIAANTAAWQGGVFALLEKISGKLPTDGSPIYIEEVPPHTVHDQSLDHYMRQALRQKGFLVTPVRTMGPILTLDAKSLQDAAVLKRAIAEDHFEYVPKSDLKGFFLLSAKLTDAKGALLATGSSVATLPFEKNEYARLPGYSALTPEGQTKHVVPVYQSRQ